MSEPFRAKCCNSKDVNFLSGLIGGGIVVFAEKGL
jgi:hypothetical protein